MCCSKSCLRLIFIFNMDASLGACLFSTFNWYPCLIFSIGVVYVGNTTGVSRFLGILTKL